MFGKPIRLFSLFGFEVKLDVSWFILVALVAWSLAAGLFPEWYGDLEQSTYIGMGVAGAAGLFVSIVWHELSHSLVARLFGMPMEGITLFVFGGVAEMDEEPPSPKAEFLMALAGPISSVILAAVAFGARFGLGAAGAPTAVTGVLTWLGVINIVLAVFNLFPGFPMDGGRAVRAILWGYRGNLRWATRIASHIGGGFGLFLMVLGFLNLVSGVFIGGLWWILIGMFVRHAAGQSYQQLVVRRTLRGEPVRRFMTEDPVTAAPDLPLDRFVEDYIYDTHHKLFPVVRDGRLEGAIHVRDVKPFEKEAWGDHTVGEAAKPADAAILISPDADATDALARMSGGDTGRLLVARDERLEGIVTLRDLLAFLSLKMELEEDVGPAVEKIMGEADPGT